jgi:uncharacterized protein (DUF1330 family)
MAAYLIVDIEILDPAAYEPYKLAVSPLAHKHGGEYLVRGGACTPLEGDWNPKRLVVFRFPSMEALKAFYEDPEYRPWKELRQRISRGSLLAVEGL